MKITKKLKQKAPDPEPEEIEEPEEPEEETDPEQEAPLAIVPIPKRGPGRPPADPNAAPKDAKGEYVAAMEQGLAKVDRLIRDFGHWDMDGTAALEQAHGALTLAKACGLALADDFASPRRARGKTAYTFNVGDTVAIREKYVATYAGIEEELPSELTILKLLEGGRAVLDFGDGTKCPAKLAHLKKV